MAEHPLAPLSENEIRQTAAVLRRDERGERLMAVRVNRVQGTVEDRRQGMAPG